MNILRTIFLFAMMISNTLLADDGFTTLGRLTKQDGVWRLVRTVEGDAIDFKFQNETVRPKEVSLQSGEEAIFRGHVQYVSYILDGKISYRPVLLVESVTPISLRKLGISSQDESVQSSMDFALEKTGVSKYIPIGIPVSTEVASAITLTATVLLMQSLTVSPAQPHVQQQLNTGLIIFAGSLATMTFIFDQLQDLRK